MCAYHKRKSTRAFDEMTFATKANHSAGQIAKAIRTNSWVIETK